MERGTSIYQKCMLASDLVVFCVLFAYIKQVLRETKQPISLNNYYLVKKTFILYYDIKRQVL